jgi:hypothetical protein
MLAGMDARDLQRAIGGVVLESAYLERVLRAAFSALIGSKYAAVIANRLMASALIDDCRRVAEVHSGIGASERDGLIASLHHCESVNHARNRVIHDDWAFRPGNVKVTLQSGDSSHEVTVTAETVSQLDDLAARIGRAADQVAAAVLAALGPASLLIDDQLRQELGHDVPSDRRD